MVGRAATVRTCGAARANGAQASNAVPPGTPALPWLEQHALRFWLVAGKGGAGKTTCAAALAVALAEQHDVLLCSADPAGSVGDVLGAESAGGVQRLRTREIDPAAELERLRELYHSQVLDALDRIGISEGPPSTGA